MPSRESEAVVLRSYPYRDADLVVSFYTRDQGKLRGVATGVRRPKNKFGVSLERLAHSRIFYFQKETAELTTLQRAELMGPANLWKASYSACVVLDLIAETADQLLPASEPHDAYFRLLKLIVEESSRGISRESPSEQIQAWAQRVLVYFLVWAARLGGWLPPLDRCIESDVPFADDEAAYFSPRKDGLFRASFSDGESWIFPAAARSLAQAMLSQRIDSIDPSIWQHPAALDLQSYLLQRTQAQLDGRLRGVEALRAVMSSKEPPFPAGG